MSQEHRPQPRRTSVGDPGPTRLEWPTGPESGDSDDPPPLARVLQQLAECAHARAALRGRIEALLDEQEQLAREEQDLLAVAVQRAQLAASTAAGPPDLKGLLDSYERTLIQWMIASAGGQQARAAAALGVRPTTLNEKMKRLGIPGPRTVSGAGR